MGRSLSLVLSEEDDNEDEGEDEETCFSCKLRSGNTSSLWAELVNWFCFGLGDRLMGDPSGLKRLMLTMGGTRPACCCCCCF